MIKIPYERATAELINIESDSTLFTDSASDWGYVCIDDYCGTDGPCPSWDSTGCQDGYYDYIIC